MFRGNEHSEWKLLKKCSTESCMMDSVSVKPYSKCSDYSSDTATFKIKGVFVESASKYHTAHINNLENSGSKDTTRFFDFVEQKGLDVCIG